MAGPVSTEVTAVTELSNSMTYVRERSDTYQEFTACALYDVLYGDPVRDLRQNKALLWINFKHTL